MYLPIHRILVPTDFSPVSDAALDYAAYIASELKADIHLLHVAETHDPEASRVNADLQQYFTEQSMRQRSRLVAAGVDPSVRLFDILTAGKLDERVQAAVNELGIDLIVMGTGGPAGWTEFQKFLRGSNASRTVHTASCPVLTLVERQETIAFREILVPLDLTKETAGKIRLAMHWAQLFSARIHLLAVTHYFEQLGSGPKNLETLLKRTADEMRKQHVVVSTEMIRHDDVVTSVLRYGDEIAADLILIATRQENKLRSLLVGSRARKIISESRVPVLSFRPEMATG